jgi:integrase
MQQHGYRPSTIKATVKTLKTLNRRCNLANPTYVKTHLATHPYTENRKFKIINDINRLYKHLNIPWQRPRSRRIETLPFLPTEEEINQLIGGLGPKLACYMLLVKDTYARACEVFNLKRTDFDPNTGTINIAPEKGSKRRRLKLKPQTITSSHAQKPASTSSTPIRQRISMKPTATSSATTPKHAPKSPNA